MTSIDIQQLSGVRNALLGLALAVSLSGCGLKGDLYLEKPAAAATGAGDPTSPPQDGSTEVPEETSELVNTEAAMDADPGTSIIEPGDINDLETPGDTVAEQFDTDEVTEEGPTAVTTEPPPAIDLQEAGQASEKVDGNDDPEEEKPGQDNPGNDDLGKDDPGKDDPRKDNEEKSSGAGDLTEPADRTALIPEIDSTISQPPTQAEQATAVPAP